MKEIDRLKNSKDLSQWICANILHDDCDNCEMGCTKGHNVIQEMLEKEVPGHKSRECVDCSKLFDCFGKPEGVESCLQFEERK